ncbi:MAG: nitrate reductase, partial [Angustibacter sp.]
IILYGMIGMLGVRIWLAHRVDFGEPVNLVPVAAGVVVAIGSATIRIGENFALTGVALGSAVTIVGYHLARLSASMAGVAPRSRVRRRRRRPPR